MRLCLHVVSAPSAEADGNARPARLTRQHDIECCASSCIQAPVFKLLYYLTTHISHLICPSGTRRKCPPCQTNTSTRHRVLRKLLYSGSCFQTTILSHYSHLASYMPIWNSCATGRAVNHMVH